MKFLSAPSNFSCNFNPRSKSCSQINFSVRRAYLRIRPIFNANSERTKVQLEARQEFSNTESASHHLWFFWPHGFTNIFWHRLQLKLLGTSYGPAYSVSYGKNIKSKLKDRVLNNSPIFILAIVEYQIIRRNSSIFNSLHFINSALYIKIATPDKPPLAAVMLHNSVGPSRGDGSHSEALSPETSLKNEAPTSEFSWFFWHHGAAVVCFAMNSEVRNSRPLVFTCFLMLQLVKTMRILRSEPQFWRMS